MSPYIEISALRPPEAGFQEPNWEGLCVHFMDGRHQRGLPRGGDTEARSGKNHEGHGEGIGDRRVNISKGPVRGREAHTASTVGPSLVWTTLGVFGQGRRPWEAEAEGPLLQLQASNYCDQYECT